MSSDIKDINSGIVEALKAHFKGRVNYFGRYKDMTKTILTPAALVEFDTSAGVSEVSLQTKVDFDISIYCILSDSTENADLECLSFATEVMNLINGNYWGLEEGRIEAADMGDVSSIQIEPQGAESNGFEVRQVSWTQQIAIGDNFWLPKDSKRADTVYAGTEPDTGKANKHKYIKLVDHDVPLVIDGGDVLL